MVQRGEQQTAYQTAKEQNMKNKDILLEYLHDMNAFAGLKSIVCPPVYLLGGSALILGDYLDRATTDFDLIDMEYPASTGRLFKMLERFDLLDPFVTPLAPGFPERSTLLDGFDHLKIHVLSKEDIIVSKLSRFSEKDRADIDALIGSCDRRMIATLINGVMSRTDFSERVKQIFHENALRFREDYHV